MSKTTSPLVERCQNLAFTLCKALLPSLGKSLGYDSPRIPVPIVKKSLRDEYLEYCHQNRTSPSKTMEELFALVGLDEVKKHFVQLIRFVHLKRRQGRSLRDHSFHVRFEGNPGTGASLPTPMTPVITPSIDLSGIQFLSVHVSLLFSTSSKQLKGDFT